MGGGGRLVVGREREKQVGGGGVEGGYVGVGGDSRTLEFELF